MKDYDRDKYFDEEDEEIEKHEIDFENLGQGWEYYLGIGENIPSYLR
ncbi:hypothetical protein [Caloranaerobacter azorensis]|nr:hypothetical protein [Caloranaerobacter azorensis]